MLWFVGSGCLVACGVWIFPLIVLVFRYYSRLKSAFVRCCSRFAVLWGYVSVWLLLVCFVLAVGLAGGLVVCVWCLVFGVWVLL